MQKAIEELTELENLISSDQEGSSFSRKTGRGHKVLFKGKRQSLRTH